MAEKKLSVAVGANIDNFVKNMKEVEKNLSSVTTETKRQSQILKAEFGAASARLDETAGASARLKLQSDYLEKALSQQRNQVAAINTAYQKSISITGETSESTQKLAVRLAKAEEEEAKIEKSLRDVTKEMQGQSAAAKKLAEDEERIQKEIEEANKQIKAQSTGLGKLRKDFDEAGKEIRSRFTNSFDAMKDVGAKLTAAGAGIVLGFGATVKVAADFEKQLSNIKAVSGATADQMVVLKDQAMEMGAKTKFSALEAAQGQEELIKAGLSVEQVLRGGLQGALELAAAGEIELKDAAVLASTALNAFKNDQLSVSKAADILAGAANASATDINELKYGLQMSSAVAAGAGITFMDTATGLAVFAQNGLKGSDAGTSFKTMLMNLIPTTDKQIMAFQKLGLMTEKGTSAFFDHEGKVKSLADISGLLQNALAGMTNEQRMAALEIMFGSDAIRAANILYKEGAAGVKKMADEMSKVTAAQVAAEKANNLTGSLEKLKGALETAAINFGYQFLPAIRKVTDGITKAVEVFTNLPGPIKTTIAVFGAVAAAAVLIGGPLLLIVGLLPTFAAGLATVGIALTAAKTAMLGLNVAMLANPIGIVIGLVGLLTAGGIALYQNWDRASEFIVDAWSAIKYGVLNGVDTALAAIQKFAGIIPGLSEKIEQARNSLSGMIESEVIAADTRAAEKEFKAMYGSISEGSEKAATSARAADASIAGSSTGIGNSMGGAAAKGKSAAEAISEAFRYMADDIDRSMSLASSRFEIDRLMLGKNAKEPDKLRIDVKELGDSYARTAEKVALLEEEYGQMVAATGETSKESKDVQYQLEQERLKLEKMTVQLNNAKQEQQKYSNGLFEAQQRLADMAAEMSNLEQKHSIEEKLLGTNASEIKKYALEVQQSTEAQALAKQQLDLTLGAYETAKNTIGLAAEETKGLYKETLTARLKYEELTNAVFDAGISLDQAKDKFYETEQSIYGTRQEAEKMIERLTDLSKIRIDIPVKIQQPQMPMQQQASGGGLDWNNFIYTFDNNDQISGAYPITGNQDAGWDVPGIGYVPGYAAGGVIQRPVMMSDLATGRPVGIAGEAGAEAIVPLKGGGGTGKAGPIIINVAGSLVTEGQIVDKTVSAIRMLNRINGQVLSPA